MTPKIQDIKDELVPFVALELGKRPDDTRTDEEFINFILQDLIDFSIKRSIERFDVDVQVKKEEVDSLVAVKFEEAKPVKK